MNDENKTPRFTALHKAFLAKEGYSLDDIVEAHELAEECEAELTHLRAESLRLVSANDALEKERDGLREQLGKAVLTAVINGKEALAAQAAEARLRGLLDESVALNNDKRQWDSRPEVKIAWVNAQIDLHKRIAALSAPPTAALPDAKDGEELLDWLEDQNVCINGYQHYDKKTREKLELLKEQPTLRAAVRAAITGATK